MIIQCEKCGTRFRLPDEKMRPEGIKARCARCKQVFFAPPPPSPEQEDFGLSPQDAEKGEIPEQSEVGAPDHRETTKEGRPGEPDDHESLWEEPQAQQEAEPEPEQFPWAPSTTTNGEETSVDQPLREEEAGESPVEEELEDQPIKNVQKEERESSFEDGSFGEFSFGLAPEQEEEEFGELEEPEKKPEEEGFRFEPADKTFEEEGLQESDREPAGENAAIDEEPMFSFEETQAAATGDDLLDEAAPIEDKPKSETVEDTAEEQIEPSPQRKSPVASLMIFFLVVLIILTAVTGYLFWKQGPQAFERMLLELTGSKSEPVASVGRIELNDYTASFLQNGQAGELFVIHGRARNLYEEPRSTIQIKGVIFNEAGKPVMQQTVFGGNALTEEQLTTLPYSKIEESMTNQFGDHLSNLNVAPSDSIPFTIVFRNLPEGVAEFTVEVVDSRPATPAETQQ